PSCDARTVVPSLFSSLVTGTWLGPDRISSANQFWTPAWALKRQDETSLMVTVECAAVVRALARRSGRRGPGLPQLTTTLSVSSENSKARQPAWASRENRGGGGAPVSTMTSAFEASSR